MFKAVRIQVPQPCTARCKWCGTWKKNNFFTSLKNENLSLILDTYSAIIREYRPKYLYVSGGEPILLPQIDKFLRQVAPWVKKSIYLFTSFQFSAKRRENLSLENMPWEKMILTHTSAGFDEEYWLDMTHGFPFELYLDNIIKLGQKPWQKRFKFILNHEYLRKELEKFANIIKPDNSWSISLKLMNNQSGDFGADEIKKSKDKVIKILDKGVANLSLPVDFKTKITGEKIIEGFRTGKGPELCPYRHQPRELRFALYKGSPEYIKFKYRFCSHFPSSKHFIFKTGRDKIEDITNAYKNHNFFHWCKKCRLKLYT
ncbi:MAG: hypothetical protein ACQES9_06860 [Myxococcota bacterium]